jgi:hypothetical protein
MFRTFLIVHDILMGSFGDQVRVDSGRMRIYTFSNNGNLNSWSLNCPPCTMYDLEGEEQTMIPLCSCEVAEDFMFF